MIDRLWKFTAVIIDAETSVATPISRLFRRESCKELAINVQGMQLEKVKVESDDEIKDELEDAYVIRLDKDHIDSLVIQYEDANGLKGYDFEPELDFLTAAFDNSSDDDEIMIICFVINDGTKTSEKIDDLGFDDNY